MTRDEYENVEENGLHEDEDDAREDEMAKKERERYCTDDSQEGLIDHCLPLMEGDKYYLECILKLAGREVGQKSVVDIHDITVREYDVVGGALRVARVTDESAIEIILLTREFGNYKTFMVLDSITERDGIWYPGKATVFVYGMAMSILLGNGVLTIVSK